MALQVSLLSEQVVEFLRSDLLLINLDKVNNYAEHPGVKHLLCNTAGIILLLEHIPCK